MKNQNEKSDRKAKHRNKNVNDYALCLVKKGIFHIIFALEQNVE